MSINPAIFKAYDVRGLYPQEVNEDAARLIGRGFVAYLKARRIAVSRDMRLSSPSMAAAFIDGARAQGADVVDYGMMGTDMLYYAVARDGHDGGVQITASHNPKEYNGIKMVRKEAFPLSGESGIGDIRDMIAKDQLPPPAAKPGSLTTANVVDDYIKHVLSFIDVSLIKPFNVVLDAGSGVAGLVAPKLFERLPCRTTQLCMELDGTFPNHEANPLIEENRQDITAEVIRQQADRLLGPEIADVDGNVEDRSDTVSVFNGPSPVIRVFASETDEIKAASTWLADQNKAGVLPHEIGVFVRSAGQLARAQAAVKESGLPFKNLDEHVETTSGYVSICTMHLAKGLEFRSVAVMACDDEVIPLQERIESVGDDADLQEIYDTERQLLYVACTRARDFLFISGLEPASEFLDDLK